MEACSADQDCLQVVNWMLKESTGPDTIVNSMPIFTSGFSKYGRALNPIIKSVVNCLDQQHTKCSIPSEVNCSIVVKTGDGVCNSTCRLDTFREEDFVECKGLKQDREYL